MDPTPRNTLISSLGAAEADAGMSHIDPERAKSAMAEFDRVASLRCIKPLNGHSAPYHIARLDVSKNCEPQVPIFPSEDGV